MKQPDAGPGACQATVIIVGWRRARHLRGCLAALAAHRCGVPFDVVVALNEPADELADELDAAPVAVRVLESDANLGFGAACNRAAAVASAPLLVFLNDDATVEDGWLDALVDAAARRPAAVAIGGAVRFCDGRWQEAGSVIWRDGWTSGVGRGLVQGDARFFFERRVEYCSASSLLVRSEDFVAVGGFDEEYYPAYFEDCDLCLRLAARGEIWFTPLASVRHLESQSTTGTYRQYLMERNHELFLRRWGTELASRPERRQDEVGIDQALRSAAGARWRVLVIDDRTPDPSLGSGLGRMADVLEELTGDGAALVTFFAGSEGGAVAPERLARAGIELVRNDLVEYRGRLGEAITDHLAERPFCYDAVIVSRPHNYERYAEALRAAMPETPIIYDAEAVYSRRIERQLALAVDRFARVALQDELAAMSHLEATIAADADAIVCISEQEAEFFRRRTTAPVVVNPPLLSASSPSGAGFDERDGMVFVAGWGAGADSPNADGLVWFVREVLGRVLARLGSATLVVTGANPPANARRLASDAVRLVGGVEDLAALYRRARLVVVPLRYGAGVKLKTVEALQHGVPVVATSVGAEGIPFAPGVVAVRDDPAGFADAVVEALADRDAWRALHAKVLAQLEAWQREPPPRIWAQLVREVIAAHRRTGASAR
ncbi:MAG: glycosyltransferase [Actinomycetota bacterium]|nr:glycosyltransferase [Actinomycetota bacterium]